MKKLSPIHLSDVWLVTERKFPALRVLGVHGVHSPPLTCTDDLDTRCPPPASRCPRCPRGVHMTDPETDEEFWHIAIMSILAEIRQDVDSLRIPASDADD